MNLKGKVIVVTGASSGIGEAIAKLFCRNGGKVALVARSKDKLIQLEKSLPGSFAFTADMTNEGEIRNMIHAVNDHYGRVDVLINNAGQGFDAAVEDIDIQTFKKIFALDLLGPIIAMQEVIPIMRAQKEGIIVNISSGTALLILPNMSPYASLKQALAKISLTAREELKGDNIHVSVVYPYITHTGFEKHTIKENPKQEWQGKGERNTLPEADPPEHVANIVLAGIQKNAAEIFAHDWMQKSN